MLVAGWALLQASGWVVGVPSQQALNLRVRGLVLRQPRGPLSKWRPRVVCHGPRLRPMGGRRRGRRRPRLRQWRSWPAVAVAALRLQQPVAALAVAVLHLQQPVVGAAVAVLHLQQLVAALAAAVLLQQQPVAALAVSRRLQQHPLGARCREALLLQQPVEVAEAASASTTALLPTRGPPAPSTTAACAPRAGRRGRGAGSRRPLGVVTITTLRSSGCTMPWSTRGCRELK